MAARATWKGYLKLSLVSCPIALFSATSESDRVKFNQINPATGNRVKQQLIDAETSAVIERDTIVKGYEHEKGRYLLLDEAELESVKIESTHTIDITTFVPRSEIDDKYLDGHYFMGPSDKVGYDAFAIIRDAMKAKDVVGIGRVVLSKRERVVMLYPFEGGIAATTLRYDYEVRKSAGIYDDVAERKPAQEMLDLASHMVEKMKGSFDPKQFEDRYEAGLLELINRKKTGAPAPTEDKAPPKGALDLMAALRASVESAGQNVVPIGQAKTKAAEKAAPAADADAPAAEAPKTEGAAEPRKRKKGTAAKAPAAAGPGDTTDAPEPEQQLPKMTA